MRVRLTDGSLAAEHCTFVEAKEFIQLRLPRTDHVEKALSARVPNDPHRTTFSPIVCQTAKTTEAGLRFSLFPQDGGKRLHDVRPSSGFPHNGIDLSVRGERRRHRTRHHTCLS